MSYQIQLGILTLCSCGVFVGVVQIIRTWKAGK